MAGRQSASTQGKDAGGWESAIAAPATAARPARDQGPRRASQAPETPAGAARAPPSATRALLGRAGGGPAGLRRAREGEPEPPDAPRIGVDHLELVALGVEDHLAARRHPAGQHEDEPAHRVDVLLPVPG